MNTDRDAQAQKALLGDSVYILDTNSPSSPLNTPSPIIDGLSPLSVASHLQDACDATRDINNPFLDASWKTELETEADHYYQPVRLVVSGSSSSSSPKRKTRSVSVPVTPEPSAATLLPTIQEAASSAPYHHNRSAPPVPRRLKQTNTTMPATYSLPPSVLGITTTSSPFSSTSGSSSTTQIRRRPSPFPLGPPPPPPPQRRPRYEPRPHIVDLATEQFNLKPTSSNTSSTSNTSALEQERARQWKLWDEERLRSLEMTREAAKNNRVQTSRAHPSSSNPAIVVRVQEKPPSPKAPSPSKSSVKRRWWCFGNNGATESDVEDSPSSHHDEKPTTSHHNLSRSSSRVSTASSATEEDDEEEWDEARTAPAAAGSGLIGLGCGRKCRQSSKTTTTTTGANGESRRRATLKKRAV